MFVLKISILVVLLALTSAEESEELPAKNIQKRGILLDIISQSVAARLKQGGGKEIQAPLLQWKEPRRIELQLQKGEYGTTSVQGRLDLGGVNYAPEQIKGNFY
ncbi:uncharacterized protein LOC115879445 [Sitophilus oryzae]|uniref:Uncharacterized protein LOC115879445 n=1 Tax=Sitophilus oryzae TaxID=7048 RepID=A0A6J2XM50_SITOR|nr:uncharacterized protein LOC115879445 [Sitophilus oryzae]